MKTWLVVVSVVAVLLAASTGVGFWMLSNTKAELTSTKTELADTDAELLSTEAELASTEAELAEIDETLEEAKARWELIEGIFMPVLTGELTEMTGAEAGAWFLEWRDQIIAIGDPTLEALFQEFIDSDISDEAAFNFFVYLFESMAEALE
jgi:hypothetical protein